MPPGSFQSSAFSWNQRLSRYAQTGQYEKTMEIFQQMQHDGLRADKFTFFPVLKACANLRLLEHGRDCHTQIIQQGLEADLFIGSSLVDMYARCGSLEDAQRVFSQMTTRDVVAWNGMILGFVKCGEWWKALDLFEQMQREGVAPNLVTFVRVLNACANVAALAPGRCIHEKIIWRGYETNVVVGNALVDMYAKCASLEEAERVFNKMSTRDTVSWTTMIVGYVKCGEGQKAVELFQKLQQHGVVPNPVTFVGVLNACSRLGALDQGRLAHEEIIQRGYESDVVVGNCLVDMYAKCGSIEEAERVFNQMPTRNTGAWTAMIAGYVKCGKAQRALELFEDMQLEKVAPSPVTFLGVLNACAILGELEVGRRAHEDIIQRGYESHTFVGSCLVDMYAKCGNIKEAENVFNQMGTRDVVAWTAMIMGFVKCGEWKRALELFEEMQQRGIAPSPVTFVGVLNACASLGALEKGRHAHEEIIQRGYELDVVLGNCLIDMYAKCGSIESAEIVFKQMPIRDVRPWTAMVMGYVNGQEWQKALQIFEQMQLEDVEPSPVTFVGVLNACASLGALEIGRKVHEEIIRRHYESDDFVRNSLVDMYAKCGSIQDAEKVFNRMSTRDVVTWSAMISGYGSHGYTKEALETFNRMCEIKVVNTVTFISLLSACSHGGFVDEGLEYFKSMSAVHNITPTVEHYACVVDLLCRAGRLCEAEELIKSMPVEPNTAIWMSLLGACRVHGNVEMGERGAKQVLKLDPSNDAAYALLSNICNAAGKNESV